MAKKTKSGRGAVVVSIDDAERKLKRRNRWGDDPDPELPRNGMLPRRKGEPAPWKTSDQVILPPNCPVQCLGIEGELKYLIDSQGVFRTWTKGDFNQAGISDLFSATPNYPKHYWPRWGRPIKTIENGEEKMRPRIESFQADDVRDALFQACGRQQFSPKDKLRGRGMWLTRAGDVIYHSGEELWIYDRDDNRLRMLEPGLHEDYLYPRLPEIPAPWPHDVAGDNPAPTLVRIYQQWNWNRAKIDPLLMLGHNCVGYLGGALKWRPAVLILGDKGTGKSALQDGLTTLFGDAVFPTSNTTAAGIYQDMRHDNRLVAVDELEPDADTRKVSDLLNLMRIAASGSWARRGGQDGAPTSYNLRCAFLFSAINNPLRSAQDYSRVCVLRLGPLGDRSRSSPPVIEENAGRRLLTVLMREWPRFNDTFALYRDALMAGGHDARGADTYGTLLAAAELVLGAEAMAELELPSMWSIDDPEKHDATSAQFWARELSAEELPEISAALPNWQQCVRWVLTVPVEPWQRGGRPSIAARIEQYENTLRAVAGGDGGGYHFADLKRDLADAGIGIETVDEVAARKQRHQKQGLDEAFRALGLVNHTKDGAEHEKGLVLQIPNDHPGTEKLFHGSKWGGGAWSEALRQCPIPGVMIKDRAVNNPSIAGDKGRATLVVLERYRREAER